MARRNGSARKFVVLSVLGLAAFGGWTLWNKKETQRVVKETTQVVKKVEKSATAVRNVW